MAISSIVGVLRVNGGSICSLLGGREVRSVEMKDECIVPGGDIVGFLGVWIRLVHAFSI